MRRKNRERISQAYADSPKKEAPQEEAKLRDIVRVRGFEDRRQPLDGNLRIRQLLMQQLRLWSMAP